MNSPRQSTTAIDTTMPRSSSKFAPPSETVVDEDSCPQSQLMAESAVLPNAVAILEKTEVATLAPTWPSTVAPRHSGSNLLHT